MSKNTPQFKDVDSRVDSNALEQEVLAYWDSEKIFEKSLEQNKEGEVFTFYDGPPYATGKPHYGHILQSAIKDTVLRYKTMQGYYAPRRVGWDTHGLPIENLVEKELGYTTKKEIEDDIATFNRKCRETVFRYVDEFTSTIKRIGRWADYDNAYSTLDRDYMESEWWTFKQVWAQDLIYKDFRSTPYCIRCATPLSNFEVSMAYKDKHDLAVYVKLPVVGEDNLFLLIWTTTPWTLPGNVAVAYSPEVEYVVVEYEGQRLILAKERVEAVLGGEAKIIKPISPEQLAQYQYTQLFDIPVEQEGRTQPFRLVVGEHVTAEDGTGLVHMAPAFGVEDFEVGKKENLPVLRTVDTLGNLTDNVPNWAGRNVFDVNKEIANNLKERELLLKQEHFKHSYPFCWRCDTPLIYYALDTWFLRVSAIKDQMLKNNEQINWIPEHVKQGRFAKGIESAPDWAISRNRFWSVPIPVWECDNEECDERVCVGSVAELQEFSGASDKQVEDIHRPYVDDITWACLKGDGTMRRISEVLDVWFDSGSMPYSQWHYPFENKEFVEGSYPADFIVESIEMTRAWFYVLHVLAAALTQEDIGLGKHKPAYKNVIGSGIIFAEDGQKLSKKLKNYPEPEPVLEQYGADTLRFYLLSSTSLGEPYRFSEKDMRSLRQNVYVTLWNVYSFFVRYANTHGWQPGEYKASENILDRWIVARTQQLAVAVTEYGDAYHIDTAARQFVTYIDDLSNWYVRRSRGRFQKPAGEVEMNEAFGTLYYVLVELSKLLAPFMPFVTEEMYRNLTSGSSVHLEHLSKTEELTDDAKQVLEVMDNVRDRVSEGLALRAQAGIKIRQPLQRMVSKPVVTDRALNALADEFNTIIREEVNVKEHGFVEDLPEGDGYARSESGRVVLNVEITEELKAEGIARDIIRHGQMLRRKAGYALDDRITVVLKTDNVELQYVITSQESVITQALQADTVISEGDTDEMEEVKIMGAILHIGVKK
ncbi:MAG: isoleucine--tRNA ligase [Candidatus Andersenbacteria bacterium]